MFRKIILLGCLLLLTTVVLSQSPQKKVALTTILAAIESEHNVKFSYNPSLIKKVSCLPLNKPGSLEDKLAKLRKQTHLDFRKIDARYIVISERIVSKNHSISGVLMSYKTKEKAAFSSVFILGTTRGTTADEQGRFFLKNVSSNQEIEIRSIGFKPVVIPIVDFLENTNLLIVLQEENIELDEVLISDYITQGISKKKSGAIEVAPKNLGILPGLIEPDVLLSLQLLPGIQSSSETASGLQIRGSSPDQNLVLFDGIKMFQSGHFFGLISSFNPYVTKKINVFRNGTSSKFGDRIGGVLDISSGDEVPQFEAGIGVNLTHGDGFVKTPLFHKKAGLVFSARRSITDWVQTITYTKFSESVFQNTRILGDQLNDQNKLSNINNDFYFQDYNLKFVAEVSPKNKLSISNLYNKNQLSYASESARFREKVTDNITYKNKGSRLYWEHQSSLNFTQNIDFHTSEYTFDYYGKREETRNNASDNRNREFVIANYVNDYGVNYEFNYDVKNDFKLAGGYQFSKTKILYVYNTNFSTPNNLLLSSENTVNTTHALFSELTHTSNNTYTSVGLRANKFTAGSTWFFEPRLFASSKVSEDLTLKVSGEIKNQAVSQIIEYRNNGIGLENNIWAIANKEIPILNSKQLAIGFLFQRNGWNLDVDVYRKKVIGLTLMTDDIANNTADRRIPFYISGESNSIGVDVLVKKRIGNYRSWVSYSFTSTEQRFKELNEGSQFQGINEIPHSLTWSHTYKLNQLELSFGWKLRSGIPYTEATGTHLDTNNNLRISYASVNEKRLPNYQKIDFSSTYKFQLSKKKNIIGKIGFSILNVLDSKNILDRTYELKVVNSDGNIEEQKLVKTDRISLGFTPNLVFRLTF